MKETKEERFARLKELVRKGRYLIKGIWRQEAGVYEQKKKTKVIYGIEEWRKGGWVPVRFESEDLEEAKEARKLLIEKTGVMHEFRVISFIRQMVKVEDKGRVFEKGIGGKSKYEVAIERIKAFCEGRKTLVSFSGGKDSQACYHLCKEAGIEFEAEYSITRFEPPEALRFIREKYPDVKMRRAYREPLIKEIERRGLPTRMVRWCCAAKHQRREGFEVTVVGVRWEESPKRRDTWRMSGRAMHQFYICPICDWSEKDVWEYLNTRGIAHCSIYDEGQKRMGCVCCPMSPKHMKWEAERWPKFAKVLLMGHKKSWEFKKRKLQNGERESYREFREFKTPEESFENWLKTGFVLKLDREQKDEEPCSFAGSGYSESDGMGAEVSEAEEEQATSAAADGQSEREGESQMKEASEAESAERAET